MSTHDNLPAVDEPKPPTLPGVLWTLAGLIFKREALLVVAVVVVLLAVGAAGVVYAQDAGVRLIAPVESRVATLEKNQADMQRMTLETNATVKMIAYRLGVTPLSLEQKDGGQ